MEIVFQQIAHSIIAFNIISLFVQLILFKLVAIITNISDKNVHILSWIKLPEIERIIYVCFDCLKVTKTQS